MKLKFKITLILLSVLAVVFTITSFMSSSAVLNGNDKVLDVLSQLDATQPLHYIPFNKLDTNKIKEGKNLMTLGFANPENSSFFGRQSKHFVCTDCHNIQREDPDLTKSNPETRLTYVAEKKMKFLPATTLYGTVNKKHWYNDDYFKKYGELVVPARDTLENAIQLCAVVCSQGRALTDSEMESMIHFLNSIGYSIGDLNMSNEIKEIIPKYISSGSNSKAVELIEDRYLEYSPATFMEPMTLSNRNQGKKGDKYNGEKIFKLSCLTCHKEGGVTNYKLNTEKLTFKHLKKFSKTHKYFSVYDITRKGTYSKNGYKPYMPNYTKERLSDQQLEDLMAYIRQMAKYEKIEYNHKRGTVF